MTPAHHSMPLKRIIITITGRVQGVGFRPTVYRYASEFKLSGFVNNTSKGVFIEIEGNAQPIQHFLEKLKTSPPPLAKIETIHITEIPVQHSNEFKIISSSPKGDKEVEISPDIATCSDCLQEVFSQGNRRYRYPFTNCTNCGPRFTIIKDRPYDRNLTSMAPFKMCPDCQREYDNPTDRRFHAQPNACPLCGPSLSILSNDPSTSFEKDKIRWCQNQIKQGKIGAIKGLGGFNLICDPWNIETVERLRIFKHRPHKAFALMGKNINKISKICSVTDEERYLLQSVVAPIVLLSKKDRALNHIAPDTNTLGIILPYTPLHHLLMEEFNFLILTSANLKDEPIAISDHEIFHLIQNKQIDFALTHDRAIEHRADDSIVQCIQNQTQIIRRSRGYVPTSFHVKQTPNTPLLSYGAELKNTFGIRKKNRVYLSQHIGDLQDYRNFEFQEEQIKSIVNLLEVKPIDKICDAHSGLSRFSSTHRAVYHHHAHMLSVMAEHQLIGEKVLGVICDGTGLGTDGKIWGFEFLEIKQDVQHFTRKAHLEEFPLPGGEVAIKEVDRIGISLAYSIGKNRSKSQREKDILSLLEHNLNCIQTSSLGRLFDGVANLLGLLDIAEYEARGAFLLQQKAEEIPEFPSQPFYNVKIRMNPECQVIIEFKTMIYEILLDIENGTPSATIAYKFHSWVADTILAVLKELKPTIVVFSGGCFQNKLLCEILLNQLKSSTFSYYFNSKIPPNDGGISFGQAIL